MSVELNTKYRGAHTYTRPGSEPMRVGPLIPCCRHICTQTHPSTHKERKKERNCRSYERVGLNSKRCRWRAQGDYDQADRQRRQRESIRQRQHKLRNAIKQLFRPSVRPSVRLSALARRTAVVVLTPPLVYREQLAFATIQWQCVVLLLLLNLCNYSRSKFVIQFPPTNRTTDRPTNQVKANPH